MLSEHQSKNANFLRILMSLRALRQSGDITEKEYRKQFIKKTHIISFFLYYLIRAKHS